MMTFDTGTPKERVTAYTDRRRNWFNPALRLVVVFNLLLILFSFTNSFSGSPATPGVADKLFGNIQVGGWRADVAWLLMSSCLLFFAFLYSLVEIRHTSARVNAVLSFVALVGFSAYVYHLLHSGLLYMG